MVADVETTMQRLDAIARLMDSAFTIPGTNVRFGLDAIVGLAPGIGDLLASGVSLYLVHAARQLGAPRHVIARMFWNVFLDTTLGSVPVIGDAFDVLFRANLKNMALLRAHVEATGGFKSARTIDGTFTRVG